ncbi:MAG: DUF4349 domain-containing protein [Chloroflexi bacterium]|nr:DUF4349 domain-containing protein [Chloroflexota bacterium]
MTSALGQPAPNPTPATPREMMTQLPTPRDLGRMIVYTTDLTILVRDVAGAPTEMANVATANGGYVASVETRDDAGLSTVVVRLKIPPPSYEAVMRGLRGLAVEVRAEKATTQDVTEEFNDGQAQIASLEATYAQLLELTKRAASVEELLKVQQQAAQVKLQIDRLKGRATVLQRLSDFATVTVTAQDAEVAIRRDYVATRAALRKAESSLAMLQTQLTRARTKEEEDAIRDRLGEAQLEIARQQDRVAVLEARASQLSLGLPVAEPTQTTRTDSSLQDDYLKVRAALRRAQEEQASLMKALNSGKTDADPDRLRNAILEVTRLTTQRSTLEERAKQLNIVLPTITPEQEAALAGLALPTRSTTGWNIPASFRAAWDASLTFLSTIASGVVFLWWTLPILAILLYRFRGRRPRRVSAAANGSPDAEVTRDPEA